ncbi:Mbov_0395 family pilin-like conjugal transfer protein [Mycoplasma sp. 4423]
MLVKITKFFEDGSINDSTFRAVANQTWTIINSVFGVLAGLAALALIIAIIVSIQQNSHTADPQQRKQHNRKILWGLIGLVFLLFAWGIVALIVQQVNAGEIFIDGSKKKSLMDVGIMVNTKIKNMLV